MMFPLSMKAHLHKQDASIIVEHLEDLWYCSHLIDPGDQITARTERKIKLSGQDEKAKSVKKTVNLTLAIEKVDLASPVLKIQGIVSRGPEDIPHGSHHTITLEQGSTFTLHKERWAKHHLSRLKDACVETVPDVLLVLHDRETALFALVSRTGYHILAQAQGKVQKKNYPQESSDFYQTIALQISAYEVKYAVRSVILASPAFFKEEVLKFLPPELKKKTVPATCSDVSSRGIHEVLKRDETQQALKNVRIAEELNQAERILLEISKTGAVTYGFTETSSAVQSGAAKEVYLTDAFIQKRRAAGTYNAVDELLTLAEQTGATIHILASEHEGGQKINALGGIAALLRYRLTY